MQDAQLTPVLLVRYLLAVVFPNSAKDWNNFCVWQILVQQPSSHLTPIPVAARSEAEVYGSSPAGIVGSNPTRHGRLSVVSVVCVVR